MAAIGNGIAWPNILFTSDGRHILIESRTTRVNRSAPIRYIHNLDVQIDAQQYEAGIDEFVESVLARLSSMSVSEMELSSLWRQLLDERADDANELQSGRAACRERVCQYV